MGFVLLFFKDTDVWGGLPSSIFVLMTNHWERILGKMRYHSFCKGCIIGVIWKMMASNQDNRVTIVTAIGHLQ